MICHATIPYSSIFLSLLVNVDDGGENNGGGKGMPIHVHAEQRKRQRKLAPTHVHPSTDAVLLLPFLATRFWVLALQCCRHTEELDHMVQLYANENCP